MDKSSELLLRSTLHDLANVLAGVQGILDLNPPEQPVNQRDRDRLEAVITEGVTALGRSRHLAMATLPDAFPEPGVVWRDLLLEALRPMGLLFRCRLEVIYDGAPEWDQWPGELLRSYVHAMTRQALPYARSSAVDIRCGAGPDHWLVRWSPAASLPESLLANPEQTPMDLGCRWALRAGGVLGATVTCTGGVLQARIPRTAPFR